MTIQNGYGITGYGDQPKPLDGSLALGVHAKPKANPLAAQEATLTFGGTATDGVYSQTYTGPDGSEVVISVTRAAGAPATNADLATEAAALVAADDAWANVATVEVDGGTPEQLNITWLHAGVPYAQGATAAPAPGTLTPATTAQAGGNAVPVGRFLVARDNLVDPDIPAAQLPLTGSTAADIIGFNLRDGSVENTGLPGVDVVESTPAGQMMSSAFKGPVYATNLGTIDAPAESTVFVVVNPAGGDPEGGARSDADGGNTVELTREQAYWMDLTPVGQRGRIYLNGM